MRQAVPNLLEFETSVIASQATWFQVFPMIVLSLGLWEDAYWKVVSVKPELHQRSALLQVRIVTTMTQEPRRGCILSKVLSIDRSGCIPEELVNHRNIRLSGVLVGVLRTFHSSCSSIGYRDHADRKR